MADSVQLDEGESIRSHLQGLINVNQSHIPERMQTAHSRGLLRFIGDLKKEMVYFYILGWFCTQQTVMLKHT